MWKISLIIRLPIIFDDNLKTTSVSFFIANFSWLSCEFDSSKFKLLYRVIFYWIRINWIIIQHIYNTFTVPCEKPEAVSIASSVMKNIVLFPARSKFVAKLTCWIALGPAPRACNLLKSVAITLYFSLKYG